MLLYVMLLYTYLLDGIADDQQHHSASETHQKFNRASESFARRLTSPRVLSANASPFARLLQQP